MDFEKLLNIFISAKQSYCAPKTIIKYQEDISNFIKWLPEPLPGNPYLEYITYLKNSGTRTVTIRSYARSIKTFLRWAYESDLLPDYVKGVKLPRDDAMPKLPLYSDEVKVIDELLNNRDWLIFHLMLDCGLRRQEVINLQVENIIAGKNVIQIVNSKGNKSRFVLIPDFVLERLNFYIFKNKIKNGNIFRSSSGGSISENTIKMLFQRLKKKTCITRLHAHLLRHTFATSYLMGGGNLEYLRVFMGHYDYSVTKEYSSLAAQMKMLGADIYKLDPIWFTRGY